MLLFESNHYVYVQSVLPKVVTIFQCYSVRRFYNNCLNDFVVVKDDKNR